jgi:hypothetical protein
MMAHRGMRFSLPSEDGEGLPQGVARVTANWISLRPVPSTREKRVGWLKRDKLVPILEEVRSPDGPAHNSLWYRTVGGYVHSGYTQRLERRLNKPLETVPEEGQLGELTIAYTQSMRYFRYAGWAPLYRLYYSSVHWITGIEEGPHEPQPWYQITDERLRVKHYLPASYLRPVLWQELLPISPYVPPEAKSIRVSLEDQTMTAYEGSQEVFHRQVSTGVHTEGETENGIPTDTPNGRFNISNKMPSRHMGDGEVTSDVDAYELLGVPWCCYFVSTGVAFHGTYWHNNFGKRMSHGCVNMRNEDAKWLYRWTSPVLEPGEWHRIERGTRVDVV